MEDYDARLAATQYGAVSGLRALSARAVADGEYDAAINYSTQALGLSHDVLSRLDLNVPAVRPLQTLAMAVLGDLDVARAAIEPVTPSVGAFAVEAQVRELASYGTHSFHAIDAPRRCRHNRPSWDGSCMSIPPCPDD